MSRPGAVGLTVLAAVLWSTGGFLIKLVDWHPMAINGARSIFALLILLIYVGRPRLTWSPAQLVGAFSYAAVTATFVAATQLTTAANAIFIQYTAPVYVAVLGSRLLGERVRLRDWLAILLVLLGLGLLLMDDLTIDNYWGLFLAFLSSLFLTSLVLSLRRQKDESPVETILLGNALAILTGLPFMLSSGPPAGDWVWIAALGIFQLALPFILQTIAITRLSAVEVISIQVLEPILNPVWVYLIIGEAPGNWALVGGGLALAAVTARGIMSARGRPGRKYGPVAKRRIHHSSSDG